MSKARVQAMETLRYTGRVSFEGRSTGWSTRERLVVYVVFPFSVVLFLGATTVPFVEAETRWEILRAVAYLFGAGLLCLIMGTELINGWRHRRLQRQPVLIDERGLTLCGFGPIPWAGLQRAERRKVKLAKVEDELTRNIIWLTSFGTRMIQEQLTEKQRKRLVPGHPSDQVTYLYLPGVNGLKANEVMDVYNSAYERYASL